MENTPIIANYLEPFCYMKKIIVIGYPKSGNTWLTRLTAELVNCPVEGFLYSNRNEEAIEGTDRISDFRLYKSHHQFHKLAEDDIKFSKLIYVVRDPRDVSISGRHYFRDTSNFFKNINWSETRLLPKISNFFKKCINFAYRKAWGKRIMRNEMNKAILYGNNNVHLWCRNSWKEHLTPYLENPNVLKVKYESLLEDPLTEAKRILDFVGIQKSEKEILKAIENQSFKRKKKQFSNEQLVGKANFLRKGKGQQWKSILSPKENQLFVELLKHELNEFGYELELN